MGHRMVENTSHILPGMGSHIMLGVGAPPRSLRKGPSDSTKQIVATVSSTAARRRFSPRRITRTSQYAMSAIATTPGKPVVHVAAVAELGLGSKGPIGESACHLACLLYTSPSPRDGLL